MQPVNDCRRWLVNTIAVMVIIIRCARIHILFCSLIVFELFNNTKVSYFSHTLRNTPQFKSLQHS